MRLNALKALHQDGKPIVNAWLSIPSSYAAEVMAHQDFDAVTVDMQHGMIAFNEALSMLQAISSTRAMPMVRAPANDGPQIMRLLDAGAYGVICPMISTAEDAAALAAACRYPPRGARSFGPSRGLLYGGMDYFAHANDEILVLPMIETVKAVENIGAILDTPGIDGIYVGPNDLSLEMGLPPRSEPDDPAMVAAIERVRKATTDRGKIAGIFCTDGPAARKRLAEGFGLVTPGNDAATLRAAFAAAVKATRAQ